MTQTELLAIGRLEGRVDSLERRTGRIETKIDRILDQVSEDRQSVADMRIEDLQRELQHRKSIRPGGPPSWKAILPWLLGTLGLAAAALTGWLASGCG